MQFRSSRARRIAGLATGALVAGAMTVPLVALAPQAQAVVGEDVAFSCVTGTFPAVAYTTDIDITAEWDLASGSPMLTADLATGFPNGAPPFVTEDDQVQTFELTVKSDGTNKVLAGEVTRDFVGGTPIPVPTLTGLGKAASKSVPIAVQVQSFKVMLGDTATNCTLAVKPTINVPVAVPEHDKSLPFFCTTFGATLAYFTDATLSGSTIGGTATLSAAIADAMPNPAPVVVSLEDQTFTSTLDTTVNGSALQLTGSYVDDFQGGVAVPMAPMTGTVAGVPGALPVTINGLSLTVGDLAPIPCVLDAPVVVNADLAAVVIPPVQTGPSEACTTATAKADSLKAKFKKAKKKFKKAKTTKNKKKVKKAKKKFKKAKKAAVAAC